MANTGKASPTPTKLGIVEERVEDTLDRISSRTKLGSRCTTRFVDALYWSPEVWEVLDDETLTEELGLTKDDLQKWRDRFPKIKKADETTDVHITIMGDTQVGKSCTVKKLLFNTFHTDLPPTVECTSYFGPNQKNKNEKAVIFNNGEKFKGAIVDTAGKGDLRLFIEQWFASSEVLVYLFDIQNILTLDGLEKLRNQELEFKKRKGKPVNTCIVVANKIDLWPEIPEKDQRKIKDRLRRMLDHENFENCPFLECSAKEYDNNVLNKLLLRNCCLMKRIKEVDDDPEVWISENSGKKKKSKCCIQ